MIRTRALAGPVINRTTGDRPRFLLMEMGWDGSVRKTYVWAEDAPIAQITKLPGTKENQGHAVPFCPAGNSRNRGLSPVVPCCSSWSFVHRLSRGFFYGWLKTLNTLCRSRRGYCVK